MDIPGYIYARNKQGKPLCHPTARQLAYRGMDGSCSFGRASSVMKEQTATSTAGVCYAVGWDERAESRAGGRVIRAGISGGFAEGEVAMEESRAGDGGAGGRAGEE